MNSKRLAGKVAVVTGASKGIGAGIAKELAAEGAAVVVNYASSREGADQVVNEITASGGKAIAVQGDVSKTEDIVQLFVEANKVFGRLDILINNAGVYRFAPLEEVTEEEFHRQFNTNVLGIILATREAVLNNNFAEPADECSLRSDQGCGEYYYPGIGQGAWAKEDSRELGQSRWS
jgi:3-oxoacyl-[acyl-carrier protein] reductase